MCKTPTCPRFQQQTHYQAVLQGAGGAGRQAGDMTSHRAAIQNTAGLAIVKYCSSRMVAEDMLDVNDR